MIHAFDVIDQPGPELGQLRQFVVLGEELHFGRAAARLRIAQPALSQAIRRLEQRVGAALFVRTSRRVALTAEGTAFLATTRRVLAEVRRGIDEVRALAVGTSGTITVGHTALAMVTVLPPILRAFQRRHPDVRLTLRELNSSDQIEQLQRGLLDAAIVTGAVDTGGLSALQLMVDPLVALVPDTHALARRARIRIRALADETLILFPRAQIPRVHDQILALCRAGGFEPKVTEIAQSWHMMACLAGAGLGVAIAPRGTRGYRVARVRAIPLVAAGAVPTTLCWRSNDTSTITSDFVTVARARIHAGAKG